MTFKKGGIPWNKGKHTSKGTKIKISEANKGHIAWNKGIPRSDEEKVKIGLGSRLAWKNPNSKLNSDDYRLSLLRNLAKAMKNKPNKCEKKIIDVLLNMEK